MSKYMLLLPHKSLYRSMLTQIPGNNNFVDIMHTLSLISLKRIGFFRLPASRHLEYSTTYPILSIAVIMRAIINIE